MKTWLNFGKLLIKRIVDHRAAGLAAEQAYYYLFSLFPLLILLLSILPYLSIDPDLALNFLKKYIPSPTSELINDTIVAILSKRNSGLLTIGIVGTVWSASNGINAFRVSMNIAFEVKETRNFFTTHIISIFLTAGLIFSLIIALGLPVFGNVLLDIVNHFSPIPEHIKSTFHLLQWIIAIIVISIELSCLYHIAPNIHLPFRQIFVGAITATILWLIFSYGFSVYLSNFSNYSATYGSLVGVMILLLWLYFTGLALIIGGEIIAILYRDIPVPKSTKTIGHPFS